MKLGRQCKKEIDVNGNISCKRNGVYHRVDGPAFQTCYGDKYWHFEGVYHREDGPAIEPSYGSKRWFLKGQEYTEENHKLKLQGKDVPALVEKWTNYFGGAVGTTGSAQTGYYNNNWMNVGQSVYIGPSITSGYYTVVNVNNGYYPVKK